MTLLQCCSCQNTCAFHKCLQYSFSFSLLTNYKEKVFMSQVILSSLSTIFVGIQKICASLVLRFYFFFAQSASWVFSLTVLGYSQLTAVTHFPFYPFSKKSKTYSEIDRNIDYTDSLSFTSYFICVQNNFQSVRISGSAYPRGNCLASTFVKKKPNPKTQRTQQL